MHFRFSSQRFALPGADDGDGFAVKTGDGSEDTGVLPVEAVAPAAQKVGEQGGDIIGDIGPLGVSGNGHPLGGGQVRSSVQDPLSVESQQLGQRVPQLSAGDDLVHEAVLLLVLGPLEALRHLSPMVC